MSKILEMGLTKRRTLPKHLNHYVFSHLDGQLMNDHLVQTARESIWTAATKELLLETLDSKRCIKKKTTLNVYVANDSDDRQRALYLASTRCGIDSLYFFIYDKDTKKYLPQKMY